MEDTIGYQTIWNSSDWFFETSDIVSKPISNLIGELGTSPEFIRMVFLVVQSLIRGKSDISVSVLMIYGSPYGVNPFLNILDSFGEKLKLTSWKNHLPYRDNSPQLWQKVSKFHLDKSDNLEEILFPRYLFPGESGINARVESIADW